MQKKDKSDLRPVNLALYTIKFPITAIISIIHRISGFFLFLCIPIFLYYWQYSLSSYNNFIKIKSCLNTNICKFVLLIIILGLFYHFIAGIRHLLMDKHIGDSKSSAIFSSYFVIILNIVFAIILGIYLW